MLNTGDSGRAAGVLTVQPYKMDNRPTRDVLLGLLVLRLVLGLIWGAAGRGPWPDPAPGTCPLSLLPAPLQLLHQWQDGGHGLHQHIGALF